MPEEQSASSHASVAVEIERADPRARRLAVALVVIGAAIGSAAFWLVDSRLPILRAWVIEDPGQAQNRVRLIAFGISAAVAIPTLVFAGYFWRLGGRVIRSNRFPPPGMRVVRDTVVWQGDGARRRGRMLQALALALTFIVGGIVALLWRLASVFRRSR